MTSDANHDLQVKHMGIDEVSQQLAAHQSSQQLVSIVRVWVLLLHELENPVEDEWLDEVDPS